MNSGPLVALEIGTSTVRVVIGEAREDDSIRISGIGECSSRGMRKGEVDSLEHAVTCVKAALSAAEDHAQVVINDVMLVFTGCDLKGVVNKGHIPVGASDRIITEREIQGVMDNARVISMRPEREIFHNIRQHFYIDDRETVMNPEGMVGVRLSADMLLLHALRDRAENIMRVATAAHVDVIEFAFGGLCSALAVLLQEQKERGVLVIDLGGGTTDYVVYANKAIAHAGVLAVGGDHVTHDIMHGLNLSRAQAEKLKVEHGSAIVDLAIRNRSVHVDMEGSTESRRVKLIDLNTIINARMEESLELIKLELREAKLIHQLGAGVVLTGGGAHMENIRKLVERVFDLPCTIGKPRNVGGLAHATEGPDFAATVGMLKHGFKALDRNANSKGLFSSFRNIFSGKYGK